MKDYYYLLSIALIIIYSIIHLYIRNPFRQKPEQIAENVSYDSAILALDRIEKFTTWLTGLQTASIAAMGFLLKDNDPKNGLMVSGFYSILFFGGSIILSTWLLSSLPSIQQRLEKSNNPSKQNDIYLMPIFPFVPFRVGRFTSLIHSYFLIGIVFFSYFIFRSSIG